MISNDEIRDLLQLLEQIEIKGKVNIYLMYKIIGFLQSKLEQEKKDE